MDRREADWLFTFCDGVSIAVSAPWRLVATERIAFGAEDHGHQFGLDRPIDGAAMTNEVLDGRLVVAVELDDLTGDLCLRFEGGSRIDIFNSSAGYEGWQAALGGQSGLMVVALGGGGLIAVAN